MTDAAPLLNRNWTMHPAWAILFAGAPVIVAAWARPLFIDDAFITFRYAENIARGHGFVYNNAAHVLGTTAPAYCLLLALARLIHVPMAAAAWTVGVAAAAAAPVLIWRIGIRIENPDAGWTAALLLALFPDWWQNSVSGMETTLAGALTAAAVLLDIKKRPALAGLTGAILILTRPDAALLPAIIFFITLARDRRAALRFAIAGAAVLVPWTVWSFVYFGSPLPHSLAAKGLIHAYPVHLALSKYFGWFFLFANPPVMVLASLLWGIGVGQIIRERKVQLAAVLWPVLFFMGLSLTRVGPFFWYKVPALPLYFLGAGLGASLLISIKFMSDGMKGSPGRKVFGIAVMAAFIVVQLVSAAPYLINRDRLETSVDKEKLLREQAALIGERVTSRGENLSDIKVYAGEVGVIGYDLMDAQIIDSAGIVSPEVLQIRRRDWERLSANDPHAGWRQKWSGTPAWSREIIDRQKPDYITSNIDYCYLRVIAAEPHFQSAYNLIDQRKDAQGHVFAVWEKKHGN